MNRFRTKTPCRVRSLSLNQKPHILLCRMTHGAWNDIDIYIGNPIFIKRWQSLSPYTGWWWVYYWWKMLRRKQLWFKSAFLWIPGVRYFLLERFFVIFISLEFDFLLNLIYLIVFIANFILVLDGVRFYVVSGYFSPVHQDKGDHSTNFHNTVMP